MYEKSRETDPGMDIPVYMNTLYAHLHVLTQVLEERFTAINNQQDRMEKENRAQFNQMEARFDQMERDTNARFNQMETRFDRMEKDTNARFNQVDTRLDRMDTRLDSMQTLMHTILLLLQSK